MIRARRSRRAGRILLRKIISSILRPCRDPKTDTIKFLTPDETARLFGSVRGHSRNRAIFLIAYRHGLRASEVGLLRTDDLDFKKLRIMVHRLKGSYSGEHPLQSDEAKVLRTYLRTRGHRRTCRYPDDVHAFEGEDLCC